MSNSNLEMSKVNRANEISELKDLTKFRLDEINKIKDYLNSEIKERKDIIKKLVNTLLLLIMQKNFLLHFCIVWHFKYCFTCNGCWNTCRISWSIFNFNIYSNDWHS